MAKATDLSRRERQIMDILYARGQASAAEVRDDLSDPPSYSSVRTLLRILEEKGHARHRQDGPRYVYRPTVSRNKASQSAMKQLVQTFFDGSTETAVAALLDLQASKLDDDALKRLGSLIDHARNEGR